MPRVGGTWGVTQRETFKPRNEWLHAVNWDLMVFDEHHPGARRETAKELGEYLSVISYRDQLSVALT